MRRTLVVFLALIAAIGLLAPPVMAQAPAPKVTISGLIDFVASVSKNWQDTDLTNARDTLGYTRERGRLDFIGEVGKSKMVWGIELDFSNGVYQGSTGNSAPGNSASFDLDTDIAGQVETKWLYVETMLTGPGSIMPFIPVASTIRAGAQPYRGHGYKNGLIIAGDFSGITVETKWSPNVNSTLTWAAINEAGSRTQSLTPQAEGFDFLASVEVLPAKGFKIKPTYVFNDRDGGNNGSAGLGSENKGGFSTNMNGVPLLRQRRHTIGVEANMSFGGLYVEPSFFYQFGTQEIRPLASGKDEVDIRAWIFDGIAGYRLGPLHLATRFMWTPGQEAQHHVANGSNVGYYQTASNPGFGYMTGWTEIQTSWHEYNNSLVAGCLGCSLRTNPSYDKYGRIMAAFKAEYSVTPALKFWGLVNASWTDEDVDTNGVIGGAGIVPSSAATRGDDNYLGTEIDFGINWKFAPNTTLDLVYAYMFTGAAFDNANNVAAGASGVPSANDSKDVYKALARIRFVF